MCVCVHVCCYGFLFSEALLIRRTVVLGGRVTCLPEYPGRANFSYILLQNLTKRLHENQKVGLARVTPHLAVMEARVTLLPRPTFLHFSFSSFFLTWVLSVCLSVCRTGPVCFPPIHYLVRSISFLC